MDRPVAKTIPNLGNSAIDAMFSVGAHIGYGRSRRHPSMEPFIFGAKNRVEIFDLEKTLPLLEEAKNFIKKLGASGKVMLFVSGKHEAGETILNSAKELQMPYVAGRWIGGTFTNFKIIRSRVDHYLDLVAKRDKGELAKYTKKERLLIDRDIEKLQRLFGGIVPMKELPAAIVIIDAKQEVTAVREARKVGVPIVALMSSDCDLKTADYPILGNDSARKSIEYFVKELVSAYSTGKKDQTS